MKIAIFHNALDNIGGAELVDLILARELNADIYTTNIDKEKIKKMGFSPERIYSIGKVPINAPLRQEFIYWKFRKFKPKKKYDFYIIAGDWAMAAAINNRPHLWYVYSPTREIWDLYKYVRGNIKDSKTRLIFDIWVFFRRIINERDSKKVMKMISISKNTQKRLKKYLERESTVIYPPTETKIYKNKKSKGYWLSVNRLINHKRIGMQLKAFEKMPNEKLIIVGSYEDSKHFQAYAKYIHKIKPKNVEIKSWVSQEELIQLYSECKGLITTSKEEDYGMTPIEAMASGKPAIAPNEGGYKETVTNKTGILIDDINPDKIIQAINEINNKLKKDSNHYKENSIKRAKEFDTKVFIKKMKKEIQKCLNQN